MAQILLNIVTIIVFGVTHRSNDGFSHGEAFWMTVCSTIVTTITNFTILWDFFSTPNFSESGGVRNFFSPRVKFLRSPVGSGLTRRQRSLVIITIIFLSYIALGASSRLFSLNLSFVNGLFFHTRHHAYHRFGDIVPTTEVQRVVVCIYASFGNHSSLELAVRLMGVAVVEGLEVGSRMRVRAYK